MPHAASSHDRPIVTRCAWCSLFAVRGRWLSEAEALGPGGRGNVEVTHGICPPCAAAVQASARG